MWTNAYAQAPGGAAPDSPIAFLLNGLPILAMLAIFYFLLIRPQQQRQKQLDTMIKALKKGDRVLTTGGMYGTVVGIDEQKVTLRIGEDTKAEFARSAVTAVVNENGK